jgi:hypothetical protein
VWRTGVAMILWSIWKARNDLFFNKSKCSPLQVLFKAKALQTEKEAASSTKSQVLAIEENRKTRSNELEPY